NRKPPPLTCAPKTRLHLVSNVETAVGANYRGRLLQQVRRDALETIARQYRINNQCCRFMTAFTQLLHRAFYPLCKQRRSRLRSLLRKVRSPHKNNFRRNRVVWPETRRDCCRGFCCAVIGV